MQLKNILIIKDFQQKIDTFVKTHIFINTKYLYVD